MKEVHKDKLDCPELLRGVSEALESPGRKRNYGRKNDSSAIISTEPVENCVEGGYERFLEL